MARWKVTAKHYLHAEQYGQPTEWERQETNQDTGRMFRKSYRVPLLIDPDDRFCVNKHEGICVVARKGTEKPGDIVFFGPPTPDMEPMDDEAQAETDSEKHKWVNPIDSLAPEIGQEFGKQLLEALNRQVDMAGQRQAVSLRGTSDSDIEALKAMVAQQQKMIEQLMSGAAPKSATAPEPAQDLADLDTRKDTAEPLVDIDPDALPAPPPIHVDRPRSTMRR
jgi:hypothetical protein